MPDDNIRAGLGFGNFSANLLVEIEAGEGVGEVHVLGREQQVNA